jgi:hypothetical protein
MKNEELVLSIAAFGGSGMLVSGIALRALVASIKYMIPAYLLLEAAKLPIPARRRAPLVRMPCVARGIVAEPRDSAKRGA